MCLPATFFVIKGFKMARSITFEIITRAQTKQLAALAATLNSIASSSKKFNSDLKFDALGGEVERLNRSLKGTGKEIKGVSNALGQAGTRIGKDLGYQMRRAANDAETLQTQINDLRKDTNRLDVLRRKSKNTADEVAKSERNLAKAQADAADAQQRIRNLRARGTTDQREITEAEQAYKNAEASFKRFSDQRTKLQDQLRREGQEVIDIDRRYNQLSRTLDALARTPSGQGAISGAIGPQQARMLRDHERALTDLREVYKTTFNPDTANLGRMSLGLNALQARMTSMRTSIPILKDMRQELQEMAKIDQRELTRAVGNTPQAIRQTVAAMEKQNAEAIKITGNVARLSQASSRWAVAEREAANVLSMGNTALTERTRVQRLFTTALSESRSVETTLGKQREQLLAQERRYANEMVELQQRIAAAQAHRDKQTTGTAAYRGADIDLNNLNTAYRNLNATIDANTANLRENEAQMTNATTQINAIQRSQQNWVSSFTSMRTAMGTNPFSGLITSLQALNRMAMTAAASISRGLVSGIRSAATAAKSFVGSAGSIFSGLSRAINGAGNLFTKFADNVVRSMERSHAAMMEMYAAGFALNMIGQQIQQFGMQGFRAMDMSLDKYMEYERARNQAAIAAASYDESTGSYTAPTALIDTIIREMQRGQAVPPWMEEFSRGRPMPVTFSAQELAQGLYYYSSAIGQPITEDNAGNVGSVVQTIMQMAAVTNTGVETAMKGVLNIAQEFGIDPRQMENTERIAKISAQMGYLANLSSMEVTDIVETFKMVGPMANILSGGEAGAGLEETFLMAFLASEVGLRGGQVGRGLNRTFTSLLDPTPKMIDAMGTFFADVTDEETFRDKFFEAGTDTLKGGIMGFMETLATLPVDQQASALATLFTENATRTMIGSLNQFQKKGGLDTWLKEMRSDNPFEWLAEAAATTANSVSGWFAFMSNAWFQFQAAVIGSVSGPLMNAFRLIGEIFFELAERIQLNPAIGQTIAAIIAGISTFAVVLGTILMVAGGILLLGRAFAMTGGMIAPFLRILAMAGLTLAGLVPLIALIAIGVGLLAAAFRADFLGIRSAVESVTAAFSDFDGTILPIIDRVMNGLGVLGTAFNELISGIFLGQGTTNTLFGVLQNLFGPLLGNAMAVQLMEVREALNGTRDAFTDFFSTRTFDISALRDAHLVLQGFLEQLFLGRQRVETAAAQNILGRALGIDNLSVILANAAAQFRGFIEQVMGFAVRLGAVWADMGRQIYSNIGRIFASGGITNVLQGIGVLMSGIARGIIVAFTAMLGAVVMVTDKIADFAEGIRKAEGEGRRFMGMAVNFNNILTAIGVTIGLALGARLVMAFSPLAAILIRIIPLVTALASGIIGIGARIAVTAAQVAISVAAWLAELAVMSALAVAKASYMVISTALSAVMGGQGLVVGMLSAAYGMLTGTVAIAATVMGGLTAVVTILGAALFVTLGALFLIAGGFTAVAGFMIITIAATQGLGAAFAALQAFISGVWSTLQVGISVLMAVGASVLNLANNFASLIGAGSGLEAMGMIVGAALSGILIIAAALIVVLAAFGVIAAAAFYGLIQPIMAAIAVFQLLKGVIEQIGPWVSAAMDMVVGDFGGAWDTIADEAGVGGRAIADALINGYIEGVNSAITADSWWAQSIANGIFPGATLIGDITGGIPYVSTEAEDYRKQLAQERALGTYADTATQRDIEIGVSVDTSQFQSIMDFLDDIGYGDEARNILIKMGIEPDNFSLGDLSPENLTKLFEIPQDMSAWEDFDWSILGPQGNEYQQAMNNWQMWQDALTSFGGDAAKAREFFEMQGWDVPTEAPQISDFLGGLEDQTEDAAAAVEANMARIEEAFKGLSGMTAEDYLGAIFDPLAGQGGKSIASFFAGGGGAPIIEALGENAPWMNEMELLADVAGTGLDMGANVYGQNLHKVLTPYLSILSEQTGVDVTTMLADIPKFIAPDEFMGIAMGDLAMGINKLGPELFKEIDLLGTDIFDAQGNAMEAAGLDWAELQTYAVGQAISGTDWNLADYLSESWDISVAEAEAYLASHGIDPEVISDATFEATEAAALTGNGAYSAMTEEMYNYLAAETNNFTNDVIEMTEAEWAKIPPAYKAVMANMGITTIITEGFNLDEAKATLQKETDELVAIVQAAGTTIGRAGANYQMEGGPESWKVLATSINEATGEVMVTLEDLDGTQVTIPAVEYGDYTRSLYDVEQATNRIKSILDNYNDIYGPNAFDDGLIPSFGSGGKAAPSMSQTEIGAALGLPTPQQADEYVADLKATVQAGISDLMTPVGGAMGGGTIEIPISLNFDTFNGDLMWIQTSLSTLRSSTGSIEIPISLDFTTFNGDLMWIQTSLSMFTSAPIEIPISLKFNDADVTNLNNLNTYADKVYTITIDLQFNDTDVTNLNTLKDNLNSYELTPAVIPITITVSGIEQINDVQMKLSYLATGSWPVTLSVEHTAAQSNINAVQNNLNGLTSGSPYGVSVTADTMNASSAIVSIQSAADALVKTYTATIATSGADVAMQAAIDTKTLLDALVGTYTASIVITTSGADAIGTIQSGLNAIDGRVATATIRQNTVLTTTTQTIALGTIKAAATGGWRAGGQPVLVGEEGPEVVWFPSNGYVYTAPETAQIAESINNPFRGNTSSSNNSHTTSPSSVSTVRGGDTYHFHGDIVLANREAGRDFFTELDRRTGKKTEMAKRGMTAVEDTRSW
jgi:TP901 family phage tail tape measure protein